MRDGLTTEHTKDEGPGLAGEYESPRLVPLGNLNRLLANTSGSLCDAQVATPGSGTEQAACA